MICTADEVQFEFRITPCRSKGSMYNNASSHEANALSPSPTRVALTSFHGRGDSRRRGIGESSGSGFRAKSIGFGKCGGGHSYDFTIEHLGCRFQGSGFGLKVKVLCCSF